MNASCHTYTQALSELIILTDSRCLMGCWAWVTAHMWMRYVTLTHRRYGADSCNSLAQVDGLLLLSHATHMNVARQTYTQTLSESIISTGSHCLMGHCSWVMPHIWICHVTRTYRRYRSLLLSVALLFDGLWFVSHAQHLNVSRYTYTQALSDLIVLTVSRCWMGYRSWVMSYIWMCHVMRTYRRSRSLLS